MWRILRGISKLITQIYNVFTVLLKNYSETLITRFPRSNFYFRPLLIAEIHMALGIWEPYVSHVFNPNKGDVVLDVGAHIGYYTLKAAKTVGSEGLVISVEPDPRNFKLLKKNVNSNRLRNVKLINCALGESSSYAILKIGRDPTRSTLMNKIQNHNTSLIKIEVKTMDDLFEEIKVQKLNWIKIDVEGAASKVLKGGFKILSQPIKMIIEVTDNKTIDLLTKLGLSIRPLLIPHANACYYYCISKPHA